MPGAAGVSMCPGFKERLKINKMMTYREAADYILGIPKFTKKHPLEHSVRFLAYLGNPQDDLRIIHVAGTNGKGSVCAYLDAMLREEGYKTGLFTSPHLIRLNERIRLDGQDIADDAFCAVFAETMDAVRRMQNDGLEHPTFFELLLGMALTAFRRFGMEFAVLETGLGGRLDATTAAGIPEVCVITKIGIDHTAYLGNTLEEIAAEKAGILKKKVPVLYARTAPESDWVIADAARALGCPCKGIGAEDYKILGRIEPKPAADEAASVYAKNPERSKKYREFARSAKCVEEYTKNSAEYVEREIKPADHNMPKKAANYIEFCCSDPYYGGMCFRVSNAADYQAENALLALEIMRVLCGKGKQPGRRPEELSGKDGQPDRQPEEKCENAAQPDRQPAEECGKDGHLERWHRALEKTVWPGRMEEVLPQVYIDGAHNKSAAEACAKNIRRMQKAPAVLLFAAMKDKDYEAMIACLCEKICIDCVIVTSVGGGRAEAPEVLSDVFCRHGQTDVRVRKDPEKAFYEAAAFAPENSVYCLGSLYLVGKIKEILQEDRS